MSLDLTDVRGRWRDVVRQFPLWRFAIGLFFDGNSWRIIGGDVTSMIIESKAARRSAQALDGASTETLETIAGIARVNESRSSDLFRAVFLGYVSVPIALAAMLSDAAPEALSAILEEYATGIVVLLIGTVVFPIVYFCANWRAKQIAWVIELYRVGALSAAPKSK
jgi:hypothetical protein